MENNYLLAPPVKLSFEEFCAVCLFQKAPPISFLTSLYHAYSEYVDILREYISKMDETERMILEFERLAMTRAELHRKKSGWLFNSTRQKFLTDLISLIGRFDKYREMMAKLVGKMQNVSLLMNEAVQQYDESLLGPTNLPIFESYLLKMQDCYNSTIDQGKRLKELFEQENPNGLS